MATFSERVKDYRIGMGLTQQQMSDILGVERSTYTHYEGGVSPKTLAQCRAFASNLGVTMDWLTGYADGPKWGPSIRSFRIQIQDAGAELRSAPSVIERCRIILRLMDKYGPPVTQEWFQAGILGVTPETVREFKQRLTHALGPQAAARLSDLTGLSEMWILLGDSDDTRFEVDISVEDYIPFIVQLIERRITGDEASAAIDQLERYVNAKRALG